MNIASPITLAAVAVMAPLATFLIIGLIAPLRRSGRPAAWVGILGATTSTVAAALLVADGRSDILIADWLGAGGKFFASIGFQVDGISASMLLVVSLVAWCVQVFSLGYMSDETPAGLGRYYTWHSLFLFSMNGLVMSPNALQLFLCWELVGLASYLLIGFYFRKPSAGRAAVKAFWITKLADIGLGAGLVALYVLTAKASPDGIGSFDWSPQVAQAIGTGGATVVAGLFFVAVMGKSAQFPLHIWLPDAMEGPTPVSALLHAATMVAAGVYLVVRAYPLFQAAPDVLLFMTYLGAWTAIFAAVIATVQTDIKKVLAYSTCSQLGYMVSGLGAGSLFGGYFHLFTHAGFKALLFLGAGALIHAVHSNELADMGGLWRKMKLSGSAFILGALALAGVPGLAGFFSKDTILEALHESGQTVPWLLLLLAAGLTAFYMTRVVALALFGKPGHHTEHAHEAPASMLIPVLLLAVTAVGAGYMGGPLARMVGAEYAFHWSMTGIIATSLGLLGIAAGWAIYGARIVTAEQLAVFAPIGNFIRASAVDRSAAWVYRNAMLGLGSGIAWFDRYVVDGVMNLTAWLAMSGGQQLRTFQSGRAGDYVYAVLVGVVLLVAAGLWNA
ncbi:MAG: NADH-quinone oxidoreductase subunit L [Myxococcota bacterium]